MRIALVSAAHPYRGGIAQFNDALAAELQVRNHTLKVFTFSRQYPSIFFPGKSQLTDDAGEATVETERSIDSINPLTWYSTGRSIAATNPDLVVINYWMPFLAPAFGTIARYVKKNTSAKVVFICHNIIPHESRPGDLVLTRYALRTGDAFVVLSGSVAKDLKTILPDALVQQTPHPIYDVYGPAVPRLEAKVALNVQDKTLLLFFGLVRDYKGLNVLLNALPKIIERVSVRLIIAGEFYEGEKHYRDTIQSLGLADHVEVINKFIPNDQVATYFSAADLVVLPYLSATQSGVVQIAFNFDRSCIVTDAGGLPEMVEHGKTGFVVPVGDQDSLAEAVIRYLEENHQSDFESAIREFKNTYSWGRLAAVIENVYDT